MIRQPPQSTRPDPLCPYPTLFRSVLRAQPGQPLVAASVGDLPAGRDIRRVISAGPVADVFLLSLIPDKLLGLSTHGISAERRQYLSDTVGRLPNTGRQIGRAHV